MQPAYTTIIIFGGLGTISLAWGILIRTGKFKRWWLATDTPITPIATAYLGIPFSISVFVMVFGALFPEVETRQRFLLYGTVLLFISFVLVIWRPRWLAPKWLLWLEDNHGDIYHQLRVEGQYFGPREWEKRVSTQEGLEEWVLEVRRKYGVEHPNGSNSFR